MLKNPSLTLYAFHLHRSLADVRTAEAEALWHSVAALSETFKIPELKQFPEQLVDFPRERPLTEKPIYFELLPQRTLTFRSVNPDLYDSYMSDVTPKRQVTLYPVDLHDSYMIDLTVSYPELNLEQLGDLNPQGCLSSSTIQASLGKTLLFYAELTEGLDAQQCLQALLPPTQNWQVVLTGEGRLFGSPIWEYQLFDKDNSANSLHCLVWLGNAETSKHYATKGRHFISLLCSRHKILFVYQQAREANETARVLYRDLEKRSQVVNQTGKRRQYLKQLHHFLEEMTAKSFEFAEYIRNILDHQTAIHANTVNYGNLLKQLEPLPGDDLVFWQNRETFYQGYQDQLAIDVRYLQAGQQLFQQTTNSIQGIVEINSIENSHHLELVVVTVASMLEGTAISAKVNHSLTKEVLDCCKIGGFWEHLLNIGLHFLYIGLPLGIVAGGIVWLWHKLR
jgi:hypothetical protein